MNRNNIIDNILIGALIVLPLVLVYMLVGWHNRQLNHYQNTLAYPPMVNGVQILKITIGAEKFSPDYFRVRSGIPARFEITSSIYSNCLSTPFIAKDLDFQRVDLNPDLNQITIAEFLAPLPGKYAFYCKTHPGGRMNGTVESNN